MKFAEFKNQIQNAYTSKFPESLCDCSIHNSFGGFISINCFLGASREEFQHYISQNDAINIRLNIDLPKNAERWNMETELPDVLTITVSSHAIKHKPPEELSYLYCCYTNVTFRKTTGNAEKIIKTFAKFVDRIYNGISEQYKAGNLLPYDEELFKSKYDK